MHILREISVQVCECGTSTDIEFGIDEGRGSGGADAHPEWDRVVGHRWVEVTESLGVGEAVVAEDVGRERQVLDDRADGAGDRQAWRVRRARRLEETVQ